MHGINHAVPQSRERLLAARRVIRAGCQKTAVIHHIGVAFRLVVAPEVVDFRDLFGHRGECRGVRRRIVHALSEGVEALHHFVHFAEVND